MFSSVMGHIHNSVLAMVLMWVIALKKDLVFRWWRLLRGGSMLEGLCHWGHALERHCGTLTTSSSFLFSLAHDGSSLLCHVLSTTATHLSTRLKKWVCPILERKLQNCEAK
jgi:hypothetical protein